MIVFPDNFTEMAVLLLVAAAVGALAVRLRQPLIVAFIAVGILVGPSVLGWVSANDQIDLLAKFGITLLLFVVGLKLDLHIIRTMGPVALATGLGQVAFTSIIGYFIGIAFGMAPITALYVAVALTFSSTIIIVKLLSDKREVDTLHGRIALGFLIVQDLVVVLAMIGLNAVGATGEVSLAQAAFAVLLKGAGFLLFVALGVFESVLQRIQVAAHRCRQAGPVQRQLEQEHVQVIVRDHLLAANRLLARPPAGLPQLDELDRPVAVHVVAVEVDR